MAAVCSGQADIGEASTFYGTGDQLAATPDAIQTSYGCPSTIAVEIVAYDGVDPIVQAANLHGLISISWDTLQAIFVAANTGTTAISGGNLNAADHFTMGNGLASQTGTPAHVATPRDTSTSNPGFAWNQIPTCAGAATSCTGIAFGVTTVAVAAPAIYPALNTQPGTGTAANCGAGFTGGQYLCDAVDTDATTCGWTVCAGGTVASTDAIIPSVRSDGSGTTQSFIARLLAVSPTSVSTAVGSPARAATRTPVTPR